MPCNRSAASHATRLEHLPPNSFLLFSLLLFSVLLFSSLYFLFSPLLFSPLVLPTLFFCTVHLYSSVLLTLQTCWEYKAENRSMFLTFIELNPSVRRAYFPFSATRFVWKNSSYLPKFEVHITNAALFPRKVTLQHHQTLGIQSPCQRMIGVYNHILRKVFRFHHHYKKVIGSLGKYYPCHKKICPGLPWSLGSQLFASSISASA